MATEVAKAKQKNRVLYVSLGGGGNSVLNQMQETTNLVPTAEDAVYVNFAKSDISEKFKGIKFIIDKQGTGRNPKVGRDIIREYTEEIDGFFENLLKFPGKTSRKYDQVVLLASLGGGTGSSLIPEALNKFCGKIPTILIGLLPSAKEGVSTLPNSINCFQTIYNDFILTDRLKSFFIVDNGKYESEYEIGTYDYKKINEYAIQHIEELLNFAKLEESSETHSSLDYNDYCRVLFWGKGVSDFGLVGINKPDDVEEFKLSSSIFSGAMDRKSAKAISVFIKFKHTKANADKNGAVAIANNYIDKIKKLFKDSFFVFGYNFNNSDQDDLIEARIVVNGLAAPKYLTKVADKTAKSVGKLRTVNQTFSTSADLSLD